MFFFSRPTSWILWSPEIFPFKQSFNNDVYIQDSWRQCKHYLSVDLRRVCNLGWAQWVISFNYLSNSYKKNISYILFVLSHFQLFVTLWIVACQNSLSLGFFQERILEWVAISSSRGSSLPRDQTCVTASSTLQVNSLPLSHRGSLPYIYIGFNRELSQ